MKIPKRVVAELCLLARNEVREVAKAWAENFGCSPDNPTLIAALYEAFLLGLPQVPQAELVLTRQGRAALAEIPNLQLVHATPTVRLRGGDLSNLYCDGPTLEEAAANLRLLFHGAQLGRRLRYDQNGNIVTADKARTLIVRTPRPPRRPKKRARPAHEGGGGSTGGTTDRAAPTLTLVGKKTLPGGRHR